MPEPSNETIPNLPEKLPFSQWRLILTPPASGAWNMAVDEALLEGMYSTAPNAVLDHAPRPVLRLYAWDPPCLSLGYAQPIQDVDLPAIKARGWEIVRRPTGGRAILHTDELTYAVIGPQNEPRLAGGVLESYQRLAVALVNALRQLNVPAESQSKSAASANSEPKGPVCFEVPSNYEITLYGKKLIGSAQSRKREGVLQHGSLPLYGDLTRITQVLKFPDEAARTEAARRLLQRATTIAEGLGKIITWEQAALAFQAAFAQTLNLELYRDSLTDQELSRAAELVEQKYANDEWTNRI